MLLGAGADPNLPDHSGGSTLLKEAAGQGCLLAVELLLDAGADPTAADESSADAVYMARSAKLSGAADAERIIDLLKTAKRKWKKT